MITEASPLILGSASPRRRAILQRLGIPLRVHPVDVDEAVRPGEDDGAYLARIVDAKLQALGEGGSRGGAALLVADTAVVLDGQIFGKPRDRSHAAAMLHALAGRSHRVRTCFAVARAAQPHRAVVEQTVDTEVRFRRLTDEHVARYVATGEGRDKAGGYAVQGLGAFLVERIVGSYANVVGLPACEVVAALEAAGVLDGYPLLDPPAAPKGW